MRASRFVLWVSLIVFAAFGLLVLDTTQTLQGRERFGAELFLPLETASSLVADSTAGFEATIREIGNLRATNRALRAENARLRAENLQAQQTAHENERLRTLLGFAQTHADHRYLPARVIGRGSNNLLPMVSINAGSSSGIKSGMAVVAPGGLVGRVVNVGTHWANVLPINNPSSSVAAVVAETEGPATGMVQSEPGRGILLTYVPSTERLLPGAWVLTSGIGGGFPPNLPIGQVVSTQQQDVALFQTAVLRPATDLNDVQDVLVLTDFVPINVPS